MFMMMLARRNDCLNSNNFYFFYHHIIFFLVWIGKISIQGLLFKCFSENIRKIIA